MDHVNSPQQPKRRRIVWCGGVVLSLLVILWLLFASIVMLPRLREHDGAWPNPVQMVKGWLFPQEEMIDLDVIGVTVFEAPREEIVIGVDFIDVDAQGRIEIAAPNEERP